MVYVHGDPAVPAPSVRADHNESGAQRTDILHAYRLRLMRRLTAAGNGCISGNANG